jgi:hypothetical protein
MPDLVANLLRDHRPDSYGKCKACGLPGTGTPHLRRPCALYHVRARHAPVRHHSGHALADSWGALRHTWARGAAFGVAVFGNLLGDDVAHHIGGSFLGITPLVVVGTVLAVLLPKRSAA